MCWNGVTMGVLLCLPGFLPTRILVTGTRGFVAIKTKNTSDGETMSVRANHAMI